MKNFRLELVSPSGLLRSVEVKDLFVHGVDGELGVLPQHAPLKTILKPGVLRYTDLDNNQEAIQIGSGIMEISQDLVKIISNQ